MGLKARAAVRRGYHTTSDGGFTYATGETLCHPTIAAGGTASTAATAAMPSLSASSVSDVVALVNGYDIPSWPMAISVLGGAMLGAMLCYFTPLPD